MKITLFQAYCTMYCSHLWSVYTKRCFNDARVAYNNVFRILLRVDRKLSISNTFVNNNIMTFESKQRTLRSSFYLRLKKSENTLIGAALSMYVRFDSAFWKRLYSECF